MDEAMTEMRTALMRRERDNGVGAASVSFCFG